MQALILAAGLGKRLNCTHKPKCLHEIGKRPLLERQLEQLAGAGVSSVVVVAGFEREQVEQAAGSAATVIVNERYAETNSLFSFLLAREAIDEGVLVLNSDLLFHPGILRRLCRCVGSAFAFDSSSGGEEEHMKVALRDGHLLEMRKDLPRERCQGENLGLLRLSRRAARSAFAAAELLVRAGRDRDWLASAINLVARRHRVAGVDVAGMPWVEIDFPEDLERARREVWPRIQASVSPGAADPPQRRGLQLVAATVSALPAAEGAVAC
jgi:choline kinase